MSCFQHHPSIFGILCIWKYVHIYIYVHEYIHTYVHMARYACIHTFVDSWEILVLFQCQRPTWCIFYIRCIVTSPPPTHIWKTHFTHMNASHHTHERVTSYIRTTHVTHTHRSKHTHTPAGTRQQSYSSTMSESLLTYEWATHEHIPSHIRMSHMSRTHTSRQKTIILFQHHPSTLVLPQCRCLIWRVFHILNPDKVGANKVIFREKIVVKHQEANPAIDIIDSKLKKLIPFRVECSFFLCDVTCLYVWRGSIL